MRRVYQHTDEAGSEALSEIWAVPALLWFVLFIGVLTMMTTRSNPDLAAELAADNARIIEAFQQASSQARRAKADLETERQEFTSQLAASQQQIQSVTEQLDQEKRRTQNTANALSAARQQAAAAQAAAESANERAARAEQMLATRSLEAVFVVDDSGSMRDEQVRLSDDQMILFEALAPLAPLRVGMIAYLRDRRTLPLQRVHAKADDGGRSLAKLNAFIDGYRSGGQVDLIAAARDSMRMLTRSANNSARKTIVIVTDVSVYESHNDADAASFVRELSGWVRSDENRAVLVVYTGTDSKDRAFFNRLSTAGGDQITVTENISELLPELLRSMTAR